LEVRFTLDLRYCALSRRQITTVSGLHPTEAPEDSGEQPSLVLRMLEQGERLWDVAKAYGTTIADIISANELSDEGAAAGKLLLIPRKR
jgi:LysM repeat protein